MSENADKISEALDGISSLLGPAYFALADLEAELAEAQRAEAAEAENARQEAALLAFETIALNGSVCTPPDSSFAGGPTLDIDAMKCAECKEAWQLLRAALASGSEGDRDAKEAAEAENVRLTQERDEARRALAELSTYPEVWAARQHNGARIDWVSVVTRMQSIARDALASGSEGDTA